MMNEALAQRPRDSCHYAQSWGLSLLIHGLVLGVAALVMGDLKLAPKPEPFKWNVAMVDPPPQPVAEPSVPKPQAKAAAKPATPPAPKRAEPQPLERQTMVAPAEPPPQTPPTPVVSRQAPVQPVAEKKPEPVVEKKPEPEVKPEPKPEIKPVLKDVQPEVPPPMPLVAKSVEPVKPVEPLVQHPTHHISTQSAESRRPPAEPVVEHVSAQASSHPSAPAPSSHAGPAPSHPAPSAPPAPPAPMVASLAPSAPVEPAPPVPAPQATRESATEPPAAPSAAPVQEVSATPAPTPSGSNHHKAKADFGWVGKALWDRVMNLKRYPHMARARHLEGRVVVRAVIRQDGHLAKVDVTESSGHEILDLDALEVLRRAFPLKFTQPLEQSEVVVQIPISYKLQ